MFVKPFKNIVGNVSSIENDGCSIIIEHPLDLFPFLVIDVGIKSSCLY